VIARPDGPSPSSRIKVTPYQPQDRPCANSLTSRLRQ
jgi:hypothetical protein